MLLRVRATFLQQFIDALHYRERIRHIKHIRLATRPSAIRIEIDRPTLVYEAPAYDMRLFAVAAESPLGCRGVEPV